MSIVRAGIIAVALFATLAQAASASPFTEKRHVNAAQNGVAEINQRPEIQPRLPDRISFANGFQPGALIVDTAERKLYFTLSDTEAYVYPVAVGKPGFAWTGFERVTRIADWPQWTPPADMRKRNPNLPARMLGGMNNPLGAKAIYLGDTEFRIHGTNRPESIGTAASSGCIRMLNGHVTHLAGLIGPGTNVYVLESLPESGRAVPPKGLTSAKLISAGPSNEATAKSEAVRIQIVSR